MVNDFTNTYIGQGPDPANYIWYVLWWPYALLHGLNPFITRLAWFPTGFNVTWGNSIPGAAIAATPLTLMFGPIAAFNVLCLIAPALAATAAFVLCEHITGAFLPSLVGGYLFGFSPYFLGQLSAHVSLVLVFPVPLAIWLVMLRLEGRLSRPPFVLLLTMLLDLQYLLRNEVVASLLCLSVPVMITAYVIAGADLRRRLASVAIMSILACGIAAITLSPILYYTFALGSPPGPINSPEFYSADLLNLVVPTPLLLIGKQAAIELVTNRFEGNLIENTAYLGVPMLIAVTMSALTDRHRARAWFLLAVLFEIAIATLGPRIKIGGICYVPLPWVAAMRMPLIDKILPVRFSMYLFLDAAVIVAILLSSAWYSRAGWILAATIALSWLPDVTAAYWATPTTIPAFFTSGAYRNYLRPGEPVLTLPFGSRGNGQLWQAETNMYFSMLGGYLGPIPAEFRDLPIMGALDSESMVPSGEELRSFLASHGTHVV